MPDEPKFSEELKKMEYEPLLPAEKKLIAGSLVLGLVLLGLLIWLSNKFFPAQGAAGILPAICLAWSQRERTDRGRSPSAARRK